MSGDRVVVVGAGAAGTAAANELRAVGFTGPITLVNGESHRPYNRTTVNKAQLQATVDMAGLGQLYPKDEGTSLLTGVSAVAVEPEQRLVRLGDGARLEYDALLVATGATPRRLDVPVHPAVRGLVTTLRTAQDAVRIRGLLHRIVRREGRPARIVVVGAGILGSETAEALRYEGAAVTLVARARPSLAGAFGPTIGSWVDRQHRLHLDALHVDRVVGVDVQPGEGPARVRLATGAHADADLVVAAVGVAAETGWLTGAGLETGEGVVTDERLRVPGRPGLYAAGDVARVAGQTASGHWGQALAQGAHAARVIAHDLGAGEDPGPLTGTPSYATRLYGRPIAVLGATGPTQRAYDLVNDEEAGLAVTVFTADDETLTGAVVLGPGKYANRLRPLVSSAAPVDAAVDLVHGLGIGARSDVA